MAGHILEAVASSQERRGLSLAGIKKALSAAGYDVPRINSRVNQAVRSLVSAGSLLRTAGAGASGSFRINRQQHHEDGQNRPVPAAAAAANSKPRGRQRKVARGGGRRGGRKRSPARKKLPPGSRKKGRIAGGRRKAAKGTGVRRPSGRIRAPRKAGKEPSTAAEPPPGGQEAQPQTGGESGSEDPEPVAGKR
ncbi:histone H1.3-like [Stegostoma tigrinum]|uniref:histone H1.3-like n=1 Tax=Stegostoma tigrinum TaxID=3053191 RepID=UPI00286FEFDC|nr:histone H1.3-like [Stegostoma tigrinum]